MAFQPSTYILQQQTGHPLDLPQPGFPHQHSSSTPLPHLQQSYASIPVGGATPWTAQPQDSAAGHPPLMSYHDLRTLFDAALRKILKYEDAILHITALSQQSLPPFITQHGIICPDCNEEVAHVCSSPDFSLLPSNLQPPRSRYEHDSTNPDRNPPLYPHPPVTLSNPVGPYFTSSTSQDGLTNPSVYIRRLPPIPSSDASSASITHFNNSWPHPPPYPYPPTFVPASLQTHFPGLTAQENPFGEYVSLHSASASIEPSTSHIRRLPPTPSNPDISGSASHSNVRPPPYAYPPTPVTSGNSAGLQFDSTGATAQENLIGVTARFAHIRRLPPTPNNPNTASRSTNPYPHSLTSGIRQPGPTAQESLYGESASFHPASASASIKRSTPHIRRLPPTPRSSDTSAFRSSSTNFYSDPPISVTMANPAGLKVHSTSSTTRGNCFGERVLTRSVSASTEPSTSRIRRLPPTPRSSDISVFASRPPSTSVGDPACLSFFTGPETEGNVFGERVTARSSTYIRQLPPTPSGSHSTNCYPHSPASVTMDNPASLQAHYTGPMAQEDCFEERVPSHSASTTFESSSCQARLLPTTPGSSDMLFESRSANPDAYPVPRLNVAPPTRDTSPYSLLYPSAATCSSCSLSTDNPWSGMRDLFRTDFECEPERTKISTNQQDESHTATYNRRLPSFKDSFPPLPLTATSALGSNMSPEALPTFSRHGNDDTSEQQSGLDWSIRYNSEVKRSLDVSPVRSLHVGVGIVNCLKFSKDGKYLAVGFRLHGTTDIYDVQTGEKTCTLRDNLNGKDIFNTALCFSPNGLYLATGGTDDLVRIWEISKNHVRNVFRSSLEEPISCIDFSPDGRLIASGTFHFGTFHVWNWRDGSRRIFENLGTEINDLRFSPDGRYIAVGVFCGDVRIWNVRTAQLVEKLLGHRTWVYSVAFTPDGTGLVSASHSEPTLKFWDISLLGMDSRSQLGDGRVRTENSTREKELLNFKGRKSPVFFVGVSSSSRWVFSCSSGGAIRIWNAHNAELQCELWPHDDVWLQLFDFSPVGGYLVSSSHKEGQVLLWRFKEI